jgi:hypothetical protein
MTRQERSLGVVVSALAAPAVCVGLLVLSAAAVACDDEATSTGNDGGTPQARPYVSPSVDALPVRDADVDAQDAAPASDATTQVDAADASIQPLAMCADLDAIWKIGATDDRAFAWGNDIFIGFANAAYADCRIKAMQTSMSEQQQVAWANRLIAWNLEFFGCGSNVKDGGPLSFDLNDTGVSHVYTTADVAALVESFMAGLAQAITDIEGTPLSTSVTENIRARLEALGAAQSGVLNSPVYTYSTCP